MIVHRLLGQVHGLAGRVVLNRGVADVAQTLLAEARGQVVPKDRRLVLLRAGLVLHGRRTLNFRDVADGVAEAINRERMPIHRAREELPFGSRIELSRWHGEYRQMLAEVVP